MAIEVDFEQVVPEGKALGRHNGKVVFAIGPLPGERALVQLKNQKRTWAEGSVQSIIHPAPQRQDVAEDHFLACSPWQGVDYAYQIALKQQMLSESFTQHKVDAEIAGFVPAPEQFGYRNKLEFTVQVNGKRAGLAFHERGSWKDLLPLPEGCRLGGPAMNAAALNVVEQLNKLGLGAAVDTLTVRQSRSNGQVIAILGLKEVTKADWHKLVPDTLAGIVVWVPPRQGQAGRVLLRHGQDHLEEEIGGLSLIYPHDSFFQVNIDMFSRALEMVMEAASNSGRVVELYSGAGTIGLPLAARGHSVTGVEISASSVELAKSNAQRNDIFNYEALLSSSEKIDPAVFDDADCVILDPPRAGLHPRVVKMLLEKLPPRIIYLSCNPVTQARDIALMAEKYGLSPVTGFDFYPGTLHLESLVFLQRK